MSIHTSLVAGGAGFLGSHLCEKLLSQNIKVICVDNLFTGSINNIKHLFDNKNFCFIHHDIILPLDINCDDIYNLASPASPIHYQKDPIYTTKVNVIGSLNLLNLALKLDIKILQASTSEVYGDPFIHPQNESYFGNVNPIGPRSCYDEGKRCAESLFFDFHRKFSLNIKIVRIFNTYGPRMQPHDGRVISNFINQALFNKDITIYGSGTQSRSFCYVDDLIEAIVLMMKSNDNITGPINIGNPDEFSMIDIAKKIISMTNSSSIISYSGLPEDDPKLRKPVIVKAMQYLNWHPKISIDDGLKNTINFFKYL
jgi:UDP-glucuronate decarboxylase